MTKLYPPTYSLTVLLGFLAFPGVSQAAIIINEIAWMGSSGSANHEWIELYNTSSDPIDVTGWTIKDGLNLNINLSTSTITIGGGVYAVLERTSDESAPGSAFFIYTGALVNTGVTLTLRDAQGQIVDQVAGGENWQGVGGNNATKETAQYTTNGWVTDVPTPGARNNTGRVTTTSPDPSPDSSPHSSQATSSVVVTSPSVRTRAGSQTVSLTLPDATLKLRIEGQTLAYVNQPLRFLGVASGVAPRIIDSLRYHWNFGDTNTATGSKEVRHRFAYPGSYVITLRAGYARHEQVVRHEITVLPVTFSISTSERGDIQLHNDAPYDVDISNYRLVGGGSITLPPHSIILPRATITVPRERLDTLPNSLVALYDEFGNLVASNLRALVLPTVAEVTQKPAARAPALAPAPAVSRAPVVRTNSVPNSAAAFTFAGAGSAVSAGRLAEASAAEEVVINNQEPALAPATDPAPSEPGSRRELAFVLLGVLLIVVVYVLMRRRPV